MRTVSNPYILNAGQPPLVVAHGGAKALWPENTMLAFKKSYELGVDALEIDIRMTKDQVLVTHHNKCIDEKSDGHGRISEMYFETLQAYNFGYRFVDLEGNRPYRHQKIAIPKLRDVLAEFPGIPLILELKDSGAWGMRAAEVLAELLTDFAPDERLIVASFHEEVVKHFYEITNGSVLLSGSKNEAGQFVLFSKSGLMEFFNTKVNFLHLPRKYNQIDLVSQELIRDAHRKHLAVHYWTINDKKDMKRLIEIGADGLVTDRPDILINLLNELGYRQKVA